MKCIITFFSFVLLSLTVQAQNDSVPTVSESSVEVYDVVAIYREMKDGRGRLRKFTSEIKGEIINYDASTGFITFKAIDGRMYSLSSDQYEYFQYDKEFKVKRKKIKKIKPRKDSGFEFSVGLSVANMIIPTGLQFTDSIVGGTTSGYSLPVCLKAGASKYLNKNSTVGLSAEYALVAGGDNYFNVGARYQYLYNPNNNAAFYFPVELKYARYTADYFYVQYLDTVSTSDWFESNTTYDAEVTLNALELNIGQGVSFALENKRSLSLEFMLFTQFLLSEEYRIDYFTQPETDFSSYGMKLSLFMNF
jgi:hypothetical protein